MPADRNAAISSNPDTEELVSLLDRLYREELARDVRPTPARNEAYLRQHAQPSALARHVSVFQRYFPYLPRQGAILDWGCPSRRSSM